MLKPFAHHDPQHGDVGCVGRHGVRGHLPAAGAELVGDVEDRELRDCRSTVKAITGMAVPSLDRSHGVRQHVSRPATARVAQTWRLMKANTSAV